jgi:hypothetical protein
VKAKLLKKHEGRLAGECGVVRGVQWHDRKGEYFYYIDFSSKETMILVPKEKLEFL